MSLILLDNEPLAAAMLKTFLNEGVSEEAAKHVVGNIVQTSLRGVDSHGINLFPHYVRAVRSGRINKHPTLNLIQTSPSTGTLDADHSFGHHAGAVAMTSAIKECKTHGVFAVNVKNSSHFAAAAYYGILAAEHNCIGLAFTNADALLRSARSPEAFLGTNPICFTAPLANEGPFCLDMATTIVSFNKIKNHRLAKESVPDSWGATKAGVPTTDPDEVATLNPIADYKGYGLAMMVDILCSVLGGSIIGKDILPMYESPIEARRQVSHFFMAIDVEKFLPAETFKAGLQTMVDRARAQKRLVDKEPVLVPGDPEKLHYDSRSKKGIPVRESIFAEFLGISNEFSGAVK